MPDSTRPFLIPLRWRRLDLCPSDQVAPQWRPWLEDRGSLTARLLAASDGDFAVHILHQTVGLPTATEARALALSSRRWGLIREVVLVGRGTPWVYARSILPLSTLSGRLRYLRQLDSRPLGEMLFGDPSMTRSPVEVTRLPIVALPASVSALLGNSAAIHPPLWGRRSVFRLAAKPLLVAEFFLPDFERYNIGR